MRKKANRTECIDYGHCDVLKWKLFDDITADSEENADVSEWKRNGLCQHCGGKFKGLFSKTCANCGKPKDY